MIDIQTKIHDKNTIEFKVGYIADKKLPESDFIMNTWIFIPESMDINRRTFSKNMFYQNVRSHIRLITPIFTFRQLAEPDSMPLRMLLKSYDNLTKDNSPKTLKQFEGEVKMTASIYKSTLRDTYRSIKNMSDVTENCIQMVKDINVWLRRYRSLYDTFRNCADENITEYYLLADEFISNVTEQHLFMLCDYLKAHHKEAWEKVKTDIFTLLDNELKYKKQKNYNYVDAHAKDKNSYFIYHASMLKKFAESNLFLSILKRHNTFFIEQLAFMLAAGLSMIFATIIAFSFQQTYGNFTLPLFIALVVSYMFKDRIKELIRFYFAHKLGSKFYDFKTSMSIHDINLGWYKEGFDYITPDKLPPHVRDKRQRNTILEVSRGISEQIILYRKKVHLNKNNVDKASNYPLEGINDIIRYNFFDFMRNMDDSNVELYSNSGDNQYATINGHRVYIVNFVIQCKYQDITSDYYRYRVFISKEGMEKVEKMEKEKTI